MDNLGRAPDAREGGGGVVTDLPMLETVGNPVAVNPDRDLRREAEKREWQIRYFRRPVRLRQRLAGALPRPSPVAAAAARGPAP